MNYYYDILLNFNDYLLPFYEWEDTDSLEYFKKIPLFQVSSKTLKDFVNYNITIDEYYLNLIKDKAKSKGNTPSYVAIFADKNGSIAIEFNESGKSIARSLLSIDDEVNINEILYTLDLKELNYKKDKLLKRNNNLRYEDSIKRVIMTELNSLMDNKDYLKLKYLYMEWSNKDNNDYNVMYKEMLSSLDNCVSSKELKIYDLIKLSYKMV